MVRQKIEAYHISSNDPEKASKGHFAVTDSLLQAKRFATRGLLVTNAHTGERIAPEKPKEEFVYNWPKSIFN